MIFLAALENEISASFVFAGIFGIVFLGILYLGSWRGYSGGAIRCVATLAAFAVAGTLAWLLGIPLGFAILGKLGIPWILRGLLGMLAVAAISWLVTFSILWSLGKNSKNENTGEPESPIFGAIVGCWTGILGVAALIFLIAGAGTIGDTMLCRRYKNSTSFPSKVCRVAVKAKKSVAVLPGLHFVENWNPLPSGWVRKLEKLFVVMEEADSASRFIQTPELQSVITLPNVYPLIYSEEIQTWIRERNVEAFLADPRINALLDDEELQKAISEIDFEIVMDQVLEAKSEK